MKPTPDTMATRKRAATETGNRPTVNPKVSGSDKYSGVGFKIIVPTLRCSRCGHSWAPRKPVVYLCPKCKSPKWAEPIDKRVARAV